MSGDRVLSTGMAKEAIQRFQQVVNGPLLDQINALDREGKVLSEANNWDGRLAAEFRGNWPGVHSQLVSLKNSLEELRAKIALINQNIMSAGGNQ
jgi:uncharacterized protein YukE